MTNDSTIRIYYDDPYQIEFTARIIDQVKQGDNWGLVLDRTCFYPESGGQPADKGWLDGVQVIYVSEEKDKIFHWVTQPLPGPQVKGKIDWSRRFDHMQQHAGQHVLSQSFYELYQAETLSFHLGEQTASVEIDLSQASYELVQRVEERANQIIFENREIKTYFVSPSNLHQIPLRKPPKKTGDIRVVEVDKFDYSACGGTHPRRTGEIGLIKITRWEKIRQNIRFEFVCGRRALADYQRKTMVTRELVSLLNVHQEEIKESVQKTLAQVKQIRKKLNKAKEELSRYQAQEMASQAQTFFITEYYQDKTPEEVKFLARQIIRCGPYATLLATRVGGMIHVVMAVADELEINLRELQSLIGDIIKGKGGGSPTLLEFRGEKPDMFSQLVKEITQNFKKRYPNVLAEKGEKNNLTLT